MDGWTDGETDRKARKKMKSETSDEEWNEINTNRRRKEKR
jgi:hypothetical protein